ncbi:ECF transporter S component [Lactiplantibacillus plantarum]|uniref:ECF transporter S component n=1 Tax=Lactiplantibacillus plantarum TaxID=1590 RepID=UPI001897B0FD|nr:ECF transporter S component [Lactiplantibacillus plantarum]MDN7036796.1 ABC transporter permease [Lactiplantibacillus plantarum]
MKWVKSWYLNDIILLALIGIFFGAIFMGTNFVYNILSAALTPFGLSGLANELLLGLWCMPGMLAGYLIRLKGSATLGELLAATVEMFFGGQWGITTLISGVVQGFGAELGYIVTGYKHYDWLGLTAAAAITTVVTFGWDLARNGYYKLQLWLLILYVVVRFISMFVFGGLLTKTITDLLDRSHVLKSTH